MVPQGCEGHFYQWRRSNGKINDPKNIFYCLMISLNSFSSLVSPKLPLSEVGFEPTPPFGDQNAQKLRRIICLEPDTLIQECEGQLYQWRRSNGKIKDPKNIIYCLIISSLVNPLHFSSKEPLSEVGFEPTPPFGDQKPQQLRSIICLESGALDHSAILTCSHNDVKGISVSVVGQIAKQIFQYM